MREALAYVGEGTDPEGFHSEAPTTRRGVGTTHIAPPGGAGPAPPSLPDRQRQPLAVEAREAVDQHRSVLSHHHVIDRPGLFVRPCAVVIHGQPRVRRACSRSITRTGGTRHQEHLVGVLHARFDVERIRTGRVGEAALPAVKAGLTTFAKAAVVRRSLGEGGRAALRAQ
jgi:hypothetical protein